MSAIEFLEFNFDSARAPALSEFSIEIKFDVLEEGLQQDLNLKLFYIHSTEAKDLGEKFGAVAAKKPFFAVENVDSDDEDDKDAAEDGPEKDDGLCISENDVILDDMDVGPLNRKGKRCLELGQECFVDFSAIPDCAKLDVAGVGVSASYRGKEFYRIGWYVRHEYELEELNTEEGVGNRPTKPEMEKVVRIVDILNPIKNKTDIAWGAILAADAKVAESRRKREEQGNGDDTTKRRKKDASENGFQGDQAETGDLELE